MKSINIKPDCDAIRENMFLRLKEKLNKKYSPQKRELLKDIMSVINVIFACGISAEDLKRLSSMVEQFSDGKSVE
jgi:hypothetical protein